jgi:hypothetical protein
MRNVIQIEMNKRHPKNIDNNNNNNTIYNITLSIVGNSLGGLFGRYAIAKLVERHCVKEETPQDESDEKDQDPSWILDGQYRLFLNIFCTTATPHLGVSRHTYVRIPRTAEIGVAHAMGDTGKDLFRLNDLIQTMATCPKFLGPLGRFRKRIAYANAYGTDFPVPAGTAAFLSDNSTYPHHLQQDQEDTYPADSVLQKLIVATLHTPVHDSEHKKTLLHHNDDDTTNTTTSTSDKPTSSSS